MLQNRLAQLREERANNDKGFTLIELLVVVVIIGILIAIAIPLYLNYEKGAANKSAAADTRNAVSAVEQCKADNNGKVPSGPATSTGGSIGLTCVSDGTGVATANPTAGTAEDETINVSDSNALTYTPSQDGTTYTISTEAGGQGDKTYVYDSTTGKIITS